MKEVSTVYLLGAGASYGHKDDLPDDKCPPLGEYLFVDGLQHGLLERDDFRPLLQKVAQHVGYTGNLSDIEPSELKCNAEAFLQDVHVEFECSNISKEQRNNAQTVLSLSYYYFYELFRRYTNSFSSEGSNYTKLARKIDNSRCGVVSLNYDCFFEKALGYTRQNFHYHPNFSQRGSLPIAKIHGSVNLISAFYAGFSGDTDDFIKKVQLLHSNRYLTDVIPIPADGLLELDYRDLVFQFDTHYEPALIPPIGGAKDYQKLGVYYQMQRFTANMLSAADELVIIGSSVSKHDEVLLRLLEENLDEGVDVTVVCGSQSNSVKSRLETRLENPQFSLDHEKFGDYIENEL